MAMISDRPAVSLVICPVPCSSKAQLAGFVLESLEPSTNDSIDAAWCAEIEWRLRARNPGTEQTGKRVDLLVVNDNP